MQAKIRYLFHSGFAVRTERHFFVFDYYNDAPKHGGLEDGVIDPEKIRDQDVVVFVSHSHSDHYNPKIFDWKRMIPKIRYVLSDDIRASQPALFVHPGREYNLKDLRVRVLESTDLGAAFLIHADGLCIYHAGDLNLWYWNGEPDAENEEMACRYRAQIDTLRGEKIDIAFVPVDPRLEEHSLLGLDYFMRTVGARIAVPMHFWSDDSIFRELKTDPRTADYRDHIAFFSRRGERIPFPPAGK